MAERSPLVSVIIPTYNSAEYLERCLLSVRDQTYDRIELLVADDESTDATPEIASRYADAVYELPAERSTQRNFGAAEAAGEYVFFIDSDMELEPVVVEQCVDVCEESSAVGVVVPERSVGDGFWAACKALERSCYVGDDDIEAARFFDCETFQEFGGYDEEIQVGGEDWDLPQRIRDAGHAIGRVDAFINHHEGRLTLTETFWTKYYYGKTMSAYLEKHPKQASKQYVPIRPAFVRQWRRLAANPVLALGMFFLKFCEYVGGGAGLLASRLS